MPALVRMRSRETKGLLYLGPALTLYALFVLWPLVQTVWISLQNWNGYGPQHFIWFSNFGDVIQDPLFRTALSHSLYWALSAAIILTFCGLGLALLIRVARVGSLPLAAVLLPALLPPVAVAAIWTLIYSPLNGMLNDLLRAIGLSDLQRSWLGDPHLALPALFVAWAWSAIGIGALAFWFALRRISADYLDLALMEGAGAFWRLRNVILPAMRPVTIAVTLINAALSFQVFDLIFVTTAGGPGYATVTVPLDMYGRAFGARTGQGAAVALFQVFAGILLAGVALTLLRPSETLETGEDHIPGRTPKTARYSAIVGLSGLLAIIVAPLFWLLASAFGARSGLVGAAPPSLNPIDWRWQALSTAWHSGIRTGMPSSLLIAGIVVVTTVLIVGPTGFALSRLIRSRRLKWLIAALLVAGLFQPTPVLVIPLFSLLKTLGLLNDPSGVLLPEIARLVPFGTLLLWAHVSQMPTHVFEAAEADGAGSWALMSRIVLPLTVPTLLLIGVWAFITSWNEYLLPTVVLQNSSVQTLPTVLGGFIGRSDTDYRLLAAGTLWALIPAVLAYGLIRIIFRFTFVGTSSRSLPEPTDRDRGTEPKAVSLSQ